MKDARPQVVAQRLLNLYRQYHVINGKWAALNPVFLKEGTATDVLTALEKLPTGDKLAQHIKNLQNGKNTYAYFDTIDPNLLPYNGMMEAQAAAPKLPEREMSALARELRGFVPNAESLERIKSLPLVKSLGDNWRNEISAAVANSPDLAATWDIVLKLDTATALWFKAGQLLAETPSERMRAEVQADMFDYENYLPMFGQAGTDLLDQLRRAVSTQSELD
ncbi:MAG: hypothetical protein LBH81_00850 [Rickettsiales bacterium]|jgi:hypothetical protein|nr:hypothetical protein [Rickettsiales bacterium]